MDIIIKIFSELIQVAIGTRICLSHTPSADEWGELYAMAKKQSLVGVCFAGVQKLQTQRQEPPEMLYLTWMGMAAKIQQRNELVNRQCVELGERLKSEGYSYCILKGQGVASLYHSLHSEPSSLSLLRQSGDIDVWVQNRSIPELVEYVKGLGVGYKATAAHVECELFDGTDVELHAEPAFFRSFWNDRKLKRWFQEDVMQGGNFGHHDEKNKGLHGGSAVGRSLNGLKRNMKFFALGPWEILSSPVWSLWHFIWRKKQGLL